MVREEAITDWTSLSLSAVLSVAVLRGAVLHFFPSTLCAALDLSDCKVRALARVSCRTAVCRAERNVAMPTSLLNMFYIESFASVGPAFRAESIMSTPATDYTFVQSQESPCTAKEEAGLV